MEELRRFQEMPPFRYKGSLFSAALFFKGNTDIVHSWDLYMGRLNLSKMAEIDRLARGITDEDMELLNRRVKSYVDFKEGRR
jgi:hypothetical protein